MDVADEMINVTTRSMLALSVGCARCHDHKFDPIPTKDYYSMAGIFRSSELRDGLRLRPPLQLGLLPHSEDGDVGRRARLFG